MWLSPETPNVHDVFTAPFFVLFLSAMGAEIALGRFVTIITFFGRIPKEQSTAVHKECSHLYSAFP